MKIVLQTFNRHQNVWYKNIMEQFKQTSFEMVIVEGGKDMESVFKETPESWDREVTVIHMKQNIFEYTSFIAIHKFISNPLVSADMYFFLHDTCVLGQEFEDRLLFCKEILGPNFDYAPIGINRKLAHDYPRKMKTKFNICVCTSRFMNHKSFADLDYDMDKKTAVRIELGGHPMSIRNFEGVNVNYNAISQVKQDKGFKPVNGSLRNHNYIGIIDLHKYVSKAFLKK